MVLFLFIIFFLFVVINIKESVIKICWILCVLSYVGCFECLIKYELIIDLL